MIDCCFVIHRIVVSENRGYIAIVIPNGSERRYVTQMIPEK